MMKIFGTTQYVKTEGLYKDVDPFDLYLQLEVKSQFDFNPNGFYLINNGDFTYYVKLTSKENDSTYYFNKYLKEEDITDEYKELISNYLKRQYD